jgi:molybdate transport repressor ModE-like protein
MLAQVTDGSRRRAVLDVRRMLLLLEVARQGSVTGAARSLSYTPSAVSQQIARLESEAGRTLLERHARGISLTEAGEVLVARGELIARQLEAARAELADLAELRAGRLRIGTFPTAGASLLPLAVTEFRDRYPDVALTVRSARFDALRQMLETREIELSLLWDYAWNRLDDEALEVKHLLDDPPVLLVSSGHSLAGRRRVELSELAGEAWITRADAHPVASALQRSCREAGFEPDIAFEANDYQEAQAMVAVRIGVALAPRLSVVNLRSDVRVIRLGTPAPTRRILVARLRDREPSPSGAAFLACLRHAADAI